MSVYTCSVQGMCCGAEARPIERAVGALRGVESVNADPTLARLTVRYDSGVLTPERIVAQVRQLGFEVQGEHGGRVQTLAGRYLRSVPLALGTLLLFVGVVVHQEALSIACLVLATLLGGALPAYGGARTLLRARSLDINALMSIAAVGALLIGEYAEAATVVLLFGVGTLLESYTLERARRSIGGLLRLAPATALVRRVLPAADGEGQNDQSDCCTSSCSCSGADTPVSVELKPQASSKLYQEIEVPVATLQIGETIIVRPGTRLPMDGLVLLGQSSVNQAPITGESMPIDKAPGDRVFAGSINGNGAIEVQVTTLAEDTTLARVIHMVEEAQAQKSPTQRLVDRFAVRYTPAVLMLAVLTALVPPLVVGAEWTTWIYRALELLVIACPCALVISTPVSIVAAISNAARAGILIKGGAALEAVGGLRAVAFDKTGTLTVGQPVVTEIIEFGEGKGQQAATLGAAPSVLHIAAAVERRSEHPLGAALVRAALAQGLELPPVTNFEAHPGLGASGVVDGRRVLVGNRRALYGGEPPAHVEAQLLALEASGQTALLVQVDGELAGIVAVADEVRPAAAEAVAALKALGVGDMVLLTGDNPQAARAVAIKTGVGDVRAELLPGEKLQELEGLLARYGSVAMVGDGVNDAPALARATVGVAMGGAGSDTALETADIALMGDDLRKLPYTIGLSRATRRVIIQNVAFAVAIKALFLLTTLLGISTLWMAIFADTGAALVVIANGMRLLRYSNLPSAAWKDDQGSFSGVPLRATPETK